MLGRTALVLSLGLAATACGGGAALMHPAHTLPVSTLTLGAGVSGNVVLGSGRHDIDAAVDAAPRAGQPVPAGPDRSFFQGAVAQSLLSPGVAPWVGARVGLGWTTEAGATYTGRSVRIDARHAFESKRVALSVGLGTSGRLVRQARFGAGHTDCTPGATGLSCPEEPGAVASSGEVPGFNDDAVTGWGVDLPVLVGWRSSAGLVQIWAGLRGGVDKLWGKTAWLSASTTLQEADLNAVRWFVGPLLGLAVAIDPLWAGVEVDLTYQSGEGQLDFTAASGGGSFHGKVEGLSVVPTGVLGARF